MARKWAAAIAAVLTGGAVMACAPGEASNQKTEAVVSTAVQPSRTTGAVAVKLTVAPQGNEARYRIREQLLGVDFPNDAVGVTNNITGAIAFDAKGNVVPAESKIVVDVTGLKSDKDRRDGYVQRNTLQTTQYPTVVLVPTAVKGVKLPLPKNGTVNFELTGDLTVRGVTKPTTWRGQAKFENGKVTGNVATTFTFADFQMEKPKVRSVLSVEDEIKLEYDFTVTN
ncbi:MAG TPA: YceI family protein [Longimicrobiales bacterium]